MKSENRPTATVEKLTGGFSLPQGEPSRLRQDIIDHLMIHPNSSFPVHVGSMAMQNLGIFKGDTLLVDRSLEPHHNQVVLAVVDGEFLVRRLHIHRGIISELNAIGELLKNLRKVAYADETNEILDKILDIKERTLELLDKNFQLSSEIHELKQLHRIEMDYQHMQVGTGYALVRKKDISLVGELQQGIPQGIQLFCQYCGADRKLIGLIVDGNRLLCERCHKDIDLPQDIKKI